MRVQIMVSIGAQSKICMRVAFELLVVFIGKTI